MYEKYLVEVALIPQASYTRLSQSQLHQTLTVGRLFEYLDSDVYTESYLTSDMGVRYSIASACSGGRMAFLVYESGLYSDVCWVIAC